jgi:hypothetical protein
MGAAEGKEEMGIEWGGVARMRTLDVEVTDVHPAAVVSEPQKVERSVPIEGNISFLPIVLLEAPQRLAVLNGRSA